MMAWTVVDYHSFCTFRWWWWSSIAGWCSVIVTKHTVVSCAALMCTSHFLLTVGV